MIKVAIFDVDGTLHYHENSGVTKRVLESLKELRSKGICVVIATGRTYHKMKEALDGYFDFLVGANGHVLMNNQEELLFKKEFNLETANTIIEYCAKESISLLLKYDDACYLNDHGRNFAWLQEGHEDPFEKQVFVSDYSTIPGIAHTAFLQCNEQQKEELKQLLPDYQFVISGESCYDIYEKQLNKAVTMDKLLKEINISWDECFAIGDGKNDMELIGKAGLGVAMGNAGDALKAIADDVTKTCQEDGVYWALKKHQLID